MARAAAGADDEWRCAAFSAVRDGAALRCPAAALPGGMHCTEHASSLAVKVRQYKEAQGEQCEGNGRSWQEITAWTDAQQDARLLARAARGFLRVARRRAEVAVLYFYGGPERFADAEAGHVFTDTYRRLGLGSGVTWPDPPVTPDVAHTFAVVRLVYFAHGTRRRVAEALRQEPAATASADAEEAADAVDDESDDAGIEIPPPGPGLGPGLGRSPPRPPTGPPKRQRKWNQDEKLACEAFWIWKRRVAPVPPIKNMHAHRHDQGLPEALLAVQKAVEALSDPVVRLSWPMGAVIELIDSTGVEHAHWFAIDLEARQVLIAANDALVTCHAMLWADQMPAVVKTLGTRFVTPLAEAANALSLFANHIAGAEASKKTGPVPALAGSYQARRCAKAVLSFVRNLRPVHRLAVALITASSNAIGAKVICAVASGLVPASDALGTAFFNKLNCLPFEASDQLDRAVCVGSELFFTLVAQNPAVTNDTELDRRLAVCIERMTKNPPKPSAVMSIVASAWFRRPIPGVSVN